MSDRASKFTDIYYLNKGDKFRFVYSDNFRDLEVVRVSESGTLIKGAVFNGETWVILSKGYSISNSSKVIPLQ